MKCCPIFLVLITMWIELGITDFSVISLKCSEFHRRNLASNIAGPKSTTDIRNYNLRKSQRRFVCTSP
jgi:hypothetical protein